MQPRLQPSIGDDGLIETRYLPHTWRGRVLSPHVARSATAPTCVVLRRSATLDLSATLDSYQHDRVVRATHAVIGAGGEVVQVAPFGRQAMPRDPESIDLTLVNGGPLLEVGTTCRTWYGRDLDHEQVYIDPEENCWHAFGAEQIESLLVLLSALSERYGPLPLLGADETEVYRGPNPGPALPLELLRQALGLDQPLAHAWVTRRLTPLHYEPRCDSVQIGPPLPVGTSVTLESEGDFGWAQITTTYRHEGETATLCAWVRKRNLAEERPAEPEALPALKDGLGWRFNNVSDLFKEGGDAS